MHFLLWPIYPLTAVPCCVVDAVRRSASGPLHKHSLGHWNNTVEGLAQNVLKMYMEFDIHLYDRSASRSAGCVCYCRWDVFVEWSG